MRSTHFETPVRRWAVQAVVLLSTMVAGIWLGVVYAQGHDVRLDEAFAALQKAAALVEASSAGQVSSSTQHRFDRHVDKALANIQDAMDHIVAAAAAAEADGRFQ